MEKITTVEELCKIVGGTLELEDTAQARVEQILNYLQENGVITHYHADTLDWLFSNECTY